MHLEDNPNEECNDDEAAAALKLALWAILLREQSPRENDLIVSSSQMAEYFKTGDQSCCVLWKMTIKISPVSSGVCEQEEKNSEPAHLLPKST